jgi:putative Holliday junction resolvase
VIDPDPDFERLSDAREELKISRIACRQDVSCARMMLAQAPRGPAWLTEPQSVERVSSIMASRHLGIDFGERLVGLSISDDAGRVAVPFEIVERRNDAELCTEIERIARREGIGVLVIGDPIQLDGRAGEASARVHRFGQKLATTTDLPIEYVAETLTSVEARRRRRASGGRERGRVDALAAQIVLQEFLDERARGR